MSAIRFQDRCHRCAVDGAWVLLLDAAGCRPAARLARARETPAAAVDTRGGPCGSGTVAADERKAQELQGRWPADDQEGRQDPDGRARGLDRLRSAEAQCRAVRIGFSGRAHGQRRRMAVLPGRPGTRTCRSKKIRSSDPDFDRLLSIPIQSSDIIALMRGRIPVREHRSARLQPVASGNGYVLLLDRIWGVHQKIFLDEQKSEVRQIEVYDVSGNMLFQANFLEMQRVDGYRVPSRLVVSNHQTKALVQLVVEKYWADIPGLPFYVRAGITGVISAA
ncbi:MAG: outer membrane lipoprotein-sorting protein [Desulfobacterales bacterium]|nr:outer membrane lipoprotein-sorting protein [Desulfobacterales bacterium]